MEEPQERWYRNARFSCYQVHAHMLYVIRSAFCDFANVITYDTLEETVMRLTTSESPDLHPLLAIPCETGSSLVIAVIALLCQRRGREQAITSLCGAGASASARLGRLARRVCRERPYRLSERTR